MTDIPLETVSSVPAGWEDILDPGESILWQGRPDTAILWSDMLSFQSFFGVFFTLFAVFWMAMAIAMGGAAGGFGGFDLIFPLFGVPFVAVGLWLVVGRILWDARLRGRTWYTLTDRTAFIATDTGGTRKLERHDLRGDMEIQIEDGSPGTVWFDRRVTHNPGGYSGTGKNRRYRGPSTTITPIGFRRIDDARRVYRLLRERVAALAAAQPPE